MLDIEFQLLSLSNIGQYLRYLAKSVSEDPDMMLVDSVDEKAIRERLCDPFYSSKKSILALENDEVIGRIEYHFYGCLQDGYKMAYVDWVYVLREKRHKGVAQALFREFEKDCKKNVINQYFLVRSTNNEAQRFYQKFDNVELNEQPLLRKTLRN